MALKDVIQLLDLFQLGPVLTLGTCVTFTHRSSAFYSQVLSCEHKTASCSATNQQLYLRRNSLNGIKCICLNLAAVSSITLSPLGKQPSTGDCSSLAQQGYDPQRYQLSDSHQHVVYDLCLNLLNIQIQASSHVLKLLLVLILKPLLAVVTFSRTMTSSGSGHQIQ